MGVRSEAVAIAVADALFRTGAILSSGGVGSERGALLDAAVFISGGVGSERGALLDAVVFTSGGVSSERGALLDAVVFTSGGVSSERGALLDAVVFIAHLRRCVGVSAASNGAQQKEREGYDERSAVADRSR